MPSGTVLIPMGDGTGSWRHNRVAGAGPRVRLSPATLASPVRRGLGTDSPFWSADQNMLRHSIPDAKRAGASLPRNCAMQKAPEGAFCLLVAGAGIEPASGGYEPPEVPLLYPAMLYSTFLVWGFATVLPLGLPTLLYPAIEQYTYKKI